MSGFLRVTLSSPPQDKIGGIQNLRVQGEAEVVTQIAHHRSPGSLDLFNEEVGQVGSPALRFRAPDKGHIFPAALHERGSIALLGSQSSHTAYRTELHNVRQPPRRPADP